MDVRQLRRALAAAREQAEHTALLHRQMIYLWLNHKARGRRDAFCFGPRAALTIFQVACDDVVAIVDGRAHWTANPKHLALWRGAGARAA